MTRKYDTKCATLNNIYINIRICISGFSNELVLSDITYVDFGLQQKVRIEYNILYTYRYTYIHC